MVTNHSWARFRCTLLLLFIFCGCLKGNLMKLSQEKLHERSKRQRNYRIIKGNNKFSIIKTEEDDITTQNRDELDGENSDYDSDDDNSYVIQHQLLSQFPPDGFDKSKCISEEALDHSRRLIEKLATSPGLYHIDHKAINSESLAPGIISAPYVGSKLLHEFVLHAPPIQNRTQDCYNNSAVIYEDHLESVTTTSQEFTSGCTPFREKALILNKFESCIASYEAVTGDEIRIVLRKLRHAIIRQSVYTDYNLKHHFIQTLINTKIQKQLATDIALKCGQDIELQHGGLDVDIQHSLLCMSALDGGTGKLSHGLHHHSMVWTETKSSYSKVKCNVHPVCARLASTELLNFVQTEYSKFMPSLRTFGSVPSLDYCKKVTESNCRVHTQCWISALREVCGKYSFCCPSLKVHEACKNSSDNVSEDTKKFLSLFSKEEMAEQKSLCNDNICYESKAPNGIGQTIKGLIFGER